jgi:hypothetical protein
MGEPLCERTAHETDYGPVIQIDGELVLDNPALDHLQARKQARARKSGARATRIPWSARAAPTPLSTRAQARMRAPPALMHGVTPFTRSSLSATWKHGLNSVSLRLPPSPSVTPTPPPLAPFPTPLPLLLSSPSLPLPPPPCQYGIPRVKRPWMLCWTLKSTCKCIFHS